MGRKQEAAEFRLLTEDLLLMGDSLLRSNLSCQTAASNRYGVPGDAGRPEDRSGRQQCKALIEPRSATSAQIGPRKRAYRQLAEYSACRTLVACCGENVSGTNR
jgi:hypothetical protein